MKSNQKNPNPNTEFNLIGKNMALVGNKDTDYIELWIEGEYAGQKHVRDFVNKVLEG